MLFVKWHCIRIISVNTINQNQQHIIRARKHSKKEKSVNNNCRKQCRIEFCQQNQDSPNAFVVDANKQKTHEIIICCQCIWIRLLNWLHSTQCTRIEVRGADRISYINQNIESTISSSSVFVWRFYLYALRCVMRALAVWYNEALFERSEYVQCGVFSNQL